MKWLLLLVLGSALETSAQSVSPEEDNRIFRSQIEELNRRYEDFFEHEEGVVRYLERLKQGIPEVRSERRRQSVEAETALRQFRLERRAKPDSSALEAQDFAQKQAEAQAFERHRRVHVQHRLQLRQISESARKIPENRDAGLE